MPPLRLFYHYLSLRLRRPFSSRQALEQWQDQQIGRLLKQIQSKSPYYQRLSLQYPRWHEYPIVQKKTMDDPLR